MNIADALQQLLVKQCDKVPSEWKTVAQWGKGMRLGVAQASARVHQLVEARLMEGRKFVILTGKTTRPVMHYRLKARHD